MYAIVIALSIFLTVVAGQNTCTCGQWVGVHCGERRNNTDGSVILKGDCSSNIIYQCPAANIPAQEKGFCSFCAKGAYVGTDYCAIGREGSKAQCTCGQWVGVHCGERRNNTDGSVILKGDCSSNIIYQCPAANIPAQEKGFCSFCAKGAYVGTDYCAIGRNGQKSKLFQKRIH